MRLNKFWVVLLLLVLTNLVYFSPFYFRGLLPFPGDLLVSFFFPWSSGGFSGFNPWTTHKEYLAADAIRQLLPWRQLAFDLIKQGQLPLWNPYNFSGNYLLANLQSAIFFPGNILFFLLPAIWAWVGNVVILMTLFGLFTALFLRSLKLSWLSAAFGGLATASISYLAGWQEILVNVQSALPFPLILFFVNKFVEAKRVRYLFGIAICLAVSIFGGHAQTVVYVFAGSLVYMLYRRIGLKAILTCFLAGALLAAVQLLPTAEAYVQSAREAKGNAALLERRTFPWANLSTLFASDYLGNTANYTYQSFDYADSRAYFGVVAMIFAFLGLTQFKKNSSVRFFALFALGALLLATWPGALLVINSHLPILSSVLPSRLIMLFDFGLVIVAAFGFEKFFTGELKHRSKILAVLALVYVLLWSVAFLKLFPFYQISLRNLVIPMATFAVASVVILLARKKMSPAILVLLALAILEPAYYFIKYQPFAKREDAFPSHPVLSYLQKNAGINRFFGFGTSYLDNNFATQYRIFSAEGYDPLYVRRYGELVASSKNGQIPPDIARSDAKFVEEDNYFRNRLFDLTGTKYILDKNDQPKTNWEPEYDKFSQDRYEMVWQSYKWKVYERKSALPRFFLADNFVVLTDRQSILDKIYDRDFGLGKTLILEEPPTIFPTKNASGSASLINYTPETVSFSLRSFGNQLFFLSDNFYPGWQATLDGAVVPIMRADYTFRAVAVPTGDHKLVFSYKPRSFVLGALISVATLLGFGVYVFVKRA